MKKQGARHLACAMARRSGQWIKGRPFQAWLINLVPQYGPYVEQISVFKSPIMVLYCLLKRGEPLTPFVRVLFTKQL